VGDGGGRHAGGAGVTPEMPDDLAFGLDLLSVGGVSHRNDTPSSAVSTGSSNTTPHVWQ
jgi:hypothetical protein